MSYESTCTAAHVSDHCSVVCTILYRCCSGSTANKTSHTLVAICRVISCILAELVVLDRTVIRTFLHCRAVESSNDTAASSCRSRKVTVVDTLSNCCSCSCITYDTCKLKTHTAVSCIGQILHMDVSIVCTSCNCKALDVSGDTCDACKHVLGILRLEIERYIVCTVLDHGTFDRSSSYTCHGCSCRTFSCDCPYITFSTYCKVSYCSLETSENTCIQL